MDTADPEPFAEIARHAAIAAAAEIARFAPDNTEVEFKADASPVTMADRAAEQAIRQTLQAAFPGHAIWGEEYGRDPSENDEYLWLLDPIDGTKSWISGLPFWSIQIALQHRGEIIVAVSHAPALDELAWAVRGQGAWLNDQRLAVSRTDEISGCRLSTGNLGTLAGDSGRWQAFGRLVAQCDRIRGYGDYYHYHRLAAGQLDAVIESDVNILDIAALSLLVQEAGGVFTDLSGQPVSLATTSVLAAANAPLHAAILKELQTHA